MTALVDQVATRLRDQVAALKSVGLAAELARLVEKGVVPQRLPAAFVLPIGDDAAPNILAAGGHRQNVTETVGVILIDRVAGDATGGKTLGDIEPVRAAIRAAIAGWEPTAPGAEPFDYRRGRLHGVFGAVFYQLDFSTTWLLEA